MGKSPIPVGNADFEIACNYLGWSDPEGGIWFIGPEEGQEFDETVIRDMRGKRFSYAEGAKETQGGVPRKDKEGKEGQEENLFPVKRRVLKIVSMLNGYDMNNDIAKALWKKGSRIFNGNLLPLGKNSIDEWPSTYRDLFGMDYEQYKSHQCDIMTRRIHTLRTMGKEMRPQAVVCFGVTYWSWFQKAFLSEKCNGSCDIERKDLKIKVCNTSRLILTGHFSYGYHFTNEALDFVVRTLKDWNVVLPRSADTA